MSGRCQPRCARSCLSIDEIVNNIDAHNAAAAPLACQGTLQARASKGKGQTCSNGPLALSCATCVQETASFNRYALNSGSFSASANRVQYAARSRHSRRCLFITGTPGSHHSLLTDND